MRNSSFILAITLLIIALSGCGSDPTVAVPTTTTSTTTTTTTTSTTAAATTTSTTSTTTTTIITAYPRQFSISSNKIVDSNGNEFVFRGVNILDPAWMDAVYYNLNAAYFNAVSSWEANIIRIPIHPAAYKYYGNSNYLNILDRVLDFAASHEIYAILDFHSIGFPPDATSTTLVSEGTPWTGSIYEYTNQELNDFWQAIANHYKDDNRVVFYELFNEPTSRAGSTESESWAAWKIKAEELIDIIRAIDPDSKIIVGGISYSYDVSYAYSNPVNRTNIVYGTHPYPNQGKSSTAAFGNLKDTYPVFATEFGFDPDAEGQHYQADSTYGTNMINYLEEKKISWTVWNFSAEWLPALLSDWNYNTTTSGTLFKSLLQTYN